MSLNIGEALSTGVDRLTTTAGLQLGIAYVALQLLTVLGMNSVILAIGPTGEMGSVPALSLPIGATGGAVLGTLGAVLSLVLTIVVFRTMAHDASELGSIPGDVTEDLFKTAVFLVIALIVQGIAISIGFVLLIVPGIFLMVCLIFTQVYVIVEDEGPFEALSSSWALTKGNRFPLFGLGVIMFVISLVVSLPTTVASFVSPAAGSVLTYVVSGFVSIFTTAVLLAAYQQLSGESSTTDGVDGVERTDDDTGFDYA